VEQVVVTLTPRDDAGAALPVDVIEVGPNHWSGFADVAVGGQWEMIVDATRQNGELLRYATMVQISSR
jgi:hypothetical protein